MSIQDDIAAIRARTDLTDAQVRQSVRRIRAQASRDGLVSATLPISQTIGLNTVSILAAEMRGDDLALTLSVVRNGRELLTDQDFVFVNPPFCIVDPNGTPTTVGPGGRQITVQPTVEDPLNAAKRMVIDAIKRQLGV